MNKYQRNRKEFKNVSPKHGCYIAKGKQNHFSHRVYLVGWIDLLGYGSMLRECNFDSTSPLAKEAAKRLRIFNNCLSDKSEKFLPILQINDGAITWRELSFRTISVTYDYLKRVISLFETINYHDIAEGYYGARMVLATGTSISMNNLKFRNINNIRADLLIKKVNNGEMSVENAIYAASYNRSFFNAIPELQANFAFSKAYIAESSGSKNGFKGNHLFIDKSIFEITLPEWITTDKIFCWEYPGLTSDFIQFKSINLDLANHLKGSGILSTEKILQNMIGDVLDKNKLVKRMKKGS